MIRRKIWLEKIQQLWEERSIIWLSGVRRMGKTWLGKQLENAEYFNCDLPSVCRQMADPESFLTRFSKSSTLVLDEIHRLEDPSLLLKIAADHFPELRILATGSSTLQATNKFRDALTDRKRSLHLCPVLWQECRNDFGIQDLHRRLLHGGFPELLLKDQPSPDFFEDWMDGFYARDVQELFGIRNRTGFLKLLRLVCLRNGGQLNITDLSKESQLSRPTVLSHLDALEIAHVLRRIPPFHGDSQKEILRQPRLYTFDTGMIAHISGWETIRESDAGLLWENLILDELCQLFPLRKIHYWRDKSQREIDFIIEHSEQRVDALEAKLTPDAFEAKSLKVFREMYPHGENRVVCPYVKEPYLLHKGNLEVLVCGVEHLSMYPI